MLGQGVTRKLAAVVSADVAGYSRLMEALADPNSGIAEVVPVEPAVRSASEQALPLNRRALPKTSYCRTKRKSPPL